MSRPSKTKQKVGLKPTGDARSYSPTKLYENQQTEQERGKRQESRSLREFLAIIRELLAIVRDLLSVGLLVIGAIVSLIDFFRTGNTGTLLWLCIIAAGYKLQKDNNLKKL